MVDFFASFELLEEWIPSLPFLGLCLGYWAIIGGVQAWTRVAEQAAVPRVFFRDFSDRDGCCWCRRNRMSIHICSLSSRLLIIMLLLHAHMRMVIGRRWKNVVKTWWTWRQPHILPPSPSVGNLCQAIEPRWRQSSFSIRRTMRRGVLIIRSGVSLSRRRHIVANVRSEKPR